MEGLLITSNSSSVIHNLSYLDGLSLIGDLRRILLPSVLACTVFFSDKAFKEEL
jgi:hypothetical protein